MCADFSSQAGVLSCEEGARTEVMKDAEAGQHSCRRLVFSRWDEAGGRTCFQHIYNALEHESIRSMESTVVAAIVHVN